MKNNLIAWVIKIDDENVLAQIWCSFNRWEWPKNLPVKFMPIWWNPSGIITYKTSQDRKIGFIQLINGYIEAKIPKSKIDEWWGKSHN